MLALVLSVVSFAPSQALATPKVWATVAVPWWGSNFIAAAILLPGTINQLRRRLLVGGRRLVAQIQFEGSRCFSVAGRPSQGSVLGATRIFEGLASQQFPDSQDL